MSLTYVCQPYHCKISEPMFKKSNLIFSRPKLVLSARIRLWAMTCCQLMPGIKSYFPAKDQTNTSNTEEDIMPIGSHCQTGRLKSDAINLHFSCRVGKRSVIESEGMFCNRGQCY